MAIEYFAEKSDLSDLRRILTLPLRLIDQGCRAISTRIESSLIDRYLISTTNPRVEPSHHVLRSTGAAAHIILLYNKKVDGDIRRTANDYGVEPIEVVATKILSKRDGGIVNARMILADL